jgi:hypothetical protein
MLDRKTIVTLCITAVIIVALLTDCPLDQLGRYLLMLVGLGG